MTHIRQKFLLAGILIVTVIVLLAVPPIQQPQQYHEFADRRSLWGIPNFMDIVSNFPFLFIGGAGLWLCLQRHIQPAYYSWVTFFSGLVLTALGSAWYHWSPADSTLLWDRLPITIVFMSLFCAALNDSLLPNTERWLLPLLLILGLASIAHWHYTGDLRFYGWVQFAPLLFIAGLLLSGALRSIRKKYLLLAFAAYGAAKLFERGDAWLYSATYATVSGHTLKHLFAGLSVYFLYRMLHRSSGINAPAV
jgi:hypothetical protein